MENIPKRFSFYCSSFFHLSITLYFFANKTTMPSIFSSCSQSSHYSISPWRVFSLSEAKVTFYRPNNIVHWAFRSAFCSSSFHWVSWNVFSQNSVPQISNRVFLFFPHPKFQLVRTYTFCPFCYNFILSERSNFTL